MDLGLNFKMAENKYLTSKSDEVDTKEFPFDDIVAVRSFSVTTKGTNAMHDKDFYDEHGILMLSGDLASRHVDETKDTKDVLMELFVNNLLKKPMFTYLEDEPVYAHRRTKTISFRRNLPLPNTTTDPRFLNANDLVGDRATFAEFANTIFLRPINYLIWIDLDNFDNITVRYLNEATTEESLLKNRHFFKAFYDYQITLHNYAISRATYMGFKKSIDNLEDSELAVLRDLLKNILNNDTKKLEGIGQVSSDIDTNKWWNTVGNDK